MLAISEGSEARVFEFQILRNLAGGQNTKVLLICLTPAEK